MATDAPEATFPSETCVYGVDRDRWDKVDSGSGTQEAELCLSVVVLGASGDLAKKKTFPALAALLKGKKFLPSSFSVIGYARSDYTDESLRKQLKEYLSGDDKAKDTFLEKVTYQQGQYDTPDGYKELSRLLCEKEKKNKDSPVGRLFYLAVPPTVYPEVLKQIKHECATFCSNKKDKSWIRVIIEKPFGRDLQSAEELSSQVSDLFTEEQVYRIDHFLGKELAQNMLVMRFANPFLQAVWNRTHIASIQIVMKEPFGTEGRGGYFDKFGIIRDVIQNHLLQLLTLLTMERPVTMHPDDIRDEKTKLVRAMRVLQQEDVVLGQYAAAQGKPGYTDDDGVPDDSNTPTYAVCRLWIDNDRWEGVPMLIKAGKAMNEKKLEMRVQFKSQPGLFSGDPQHMRNEFVMRINPDEAMYMKIVMKEPGLDMNYAMSELNLTYKERYETYIPEAYERLILDAILGNQQHYVRRDELRASWAIFTPVLHAIDRGDGPTVHKYSYGTRGLEEGDKLIENSGYVRSKNYVWKPPGETSKI